ncbi:alpha/beta hydrolase family protein [Nocardia stercoris]|uniref:Lipase n=1 Tax=Nocardia stercoris TaxID=2483361 RepID=A0A3M2KPZ3_9NOCA|nr:lipase family protein [Nocardia stercoris]RMI27732.1 lipase [Nocardia stercoris]
MTTETYRLLRDRRIRAIGCTAVLFGISILATGCEGSAEKSSLPAPVATDRGRLVNAERLRAYSADDIRTALAADEFDFSTVQFDVDAYRLTYDTVDPAGRPTTATGLLALPRNDQRDLVTVAYEHGTQPTRAAAASVAEDSGDRAATLAYAAAGFAGVAPDYLGLGLGPNPHPYLDLPSETTASVDMLRAARAQATNLGLRLRNAVDIVGFSQGGPAAMALAHALQDNADNDFQPAAIAAISGPFDLRNAELPALLDGTLDPGAGSFYAAYLLVSWNRLHGLYNSPSEVFRAPYDATVEQLFDGTHTFDDIVAGLAPDIDHLLTPHGIDMLRNPTGALDAAMTSSDSACGSWTPHLPVQLYTGSEDHDVSVDNSTDCQAALRSHGIDAPVIDVGPVDHNGSGIRGTAQALQWFTDLDAAN